VKIIPRIERMTTGIPNGNPVTHELYSASPKAIIVATPETKRMYIPISDKAKYFLFSENIAPVKPKLKPRIPKIPTYNNG
jgi:hypothetical protein